MTPGNLFADATPPSQGERFDTVLSHHNLVIERIISSASMTPGSVYLQSQDEWVVLLKGEAILCVDGTKMHLQAGDHVFLPAGQPHSVQQTSEGAMWLAVHLHPAA